MFENIIKKLEQDPKSQELLNEALNELVKLDQKEREIAIKQLHEITGIGTDMWEKEVNSCKNYDSNLSTSGNQEKNTRQTSFYNRDNIIVEQIYREGNSSFIVYDINEKISHEASVYEDGEFIIEPMNGYGLEQESVKLPSGIKEYGSTSDLLSDIDKHIRKYMDVSDDYYRITAYYVLLAWLYDRFHTIPYLRALGDTGCGKSRMLDVVGGLCYKPMFMSGATTVSPIFRMIEAWKGTLIIDEADMKNSKEYSTIVKILNCGFEKGKPIVRADLNNQTETIHYSVYCPKVLATRKLFEDQALESRCLTEIMKETTRTDIPSVFKSDFFEEQQELRNKLLLYRFRNFNSTDNEAIVQEDLSEVEPRIKQISEAMLCILAKEKDSLDNFLFYIREHQRRLIEERSSTLQGLIVQELINQIKINKPIRSGNDMLYPISAALIANNLEYFVNEKTVGQELKSLGLITKVSRIPGQSITKRCIIKDEQVFRKLKKRYILEEEDTKNA